MEKFIPGREIQVAILGKKKLGAIELRPKRKFYDYKAKYSSKANTKHIIPVNIKTKEYQNVMNIALKAHKVLKCRGVTRSDLNFIMESFIFGDKHSARNDKPFISARNSIIPWHEFLLFIRLDYKRCFKK